MSKFEFIAVSASDGVATITLNRPPVNILHIPMLAEIETALDGVGHDPSVAAIVFNALGKTFSAGVDVADHTPEKTAPMIRVFHSVFRRLAATDALTIAVVQGAALGGGCELACFCDIVLASDRAKFGQPEVQVGVFPPVAASVLPFQLGLKKAVELTVLGATIDAPEALRIGLANQVFASEEFSTRTSEYIGQIGRLSRPVLRLAKKATVAGWRERVLEQLDRAEKLYLDDLMNLADAHEGIAAFLGKRPPQWKHA
ncbi:MAG: enoyl-CoA hydratase/isomerase family protein [Phycisphaerae bacterium]